VESFTVIDTLRFDCANNDELTAAKISVE